MKTDIFFDDYAKKLCGEYKDAYDKMYIYINAAMAVSSGDDFNTVMNEVVDLLLSGQQDQRALEDIIGNDLQAFCDNLIKANRSSWMQRFLNFLNAYRILAIIALIFECFTLLVDYVDGIHNPWLITIEMGGFFLAILISSSLFFLYRLFAKYAIFHYQWYTKKIDNIITFIFIAIIFVIIFFFPEQIHQYVLIPRWLFIPSMLIIYIVCTLKKRKEKKKEIIDGTHISYDKIAFDTIIDTNRKQYLRYCTKCSKKSIVPEDVQTWYEKNIEKKCVEKKSVNISSVSLFYHQFLELC